MKTTSDTILDEVWAVKDRLSARNGHNLSATCRAIYAEQAEAPGRFLVLGKQKDAQQVETQQPPLASLSVTSPVT